MRNSRLLPYETIVQAASGEPEAVNTSWSVKAVLIRSS